MSVQNYEKQLKVKYMYVSLESLMKARMKTAFKRIMFPRRSKNVFKQYQPQTHLIGKLENPKLKLPDFKSINYTDFISEIDYYIEKQGQKEQALNINQEVAKIFHRFPSRTEEQLKSKFGNAWQDKIGDLL